IDLLLGNVPLREFQRPAVYADLHEKLPRRFSAFWLSVILCNATRICTPRCRVGSSSDWPYAVRLTARRSPWRAISMSATWAETIARTDRNCGPRLPAA